MKISILKKTILIFLLIAANGFPMVSFNVFVQKPFDSKGFSFIYSAGYCSRMPKIPYTYYEVGFSALPSFRDGVVKNLAQYSVEKSYLKSYYGTYAAYYYFLFPIFRPGVMFGAGFKQREIWRGESEGSLHRAAVSSFEFTPTYGLVANIGMVSIAFSNLGAGGGINVQF